MSKGDYPIGAAEDMAAPYNEPKHVPYKRFVSVSLSYYDTVMAPENTSDEDIRALIYNRIHNGLLPKDYDIDETVILNE